MEERIKSVQGRLNTCSREKKALQEKQDALAEALLDKDTLHAEHNALHKEYKDLLERYHHLESSVLKSRRSSLDTSITQEDLSSSVASLALSPKAAVC
ncbi:hypothetical protein BGX26_009131, partial [Mortierella sp. AD094]